MTINLYGTTCTIGQSATKDGFYQFTVTDVSHIDLNRIVREQYESGNLVTLLTDGKEPKGLLIHKEFLARFSPEDNIFLAGYKLHPNVGYGHLRAEYKGGSYRLMGETQGGALGDVARLLYISPQEMDKLPAELAAARAFTRKITVKVHTL